MLLYFAWAVTCGRLSELMLVLVLSCGTPVGLEDRLHLLSRGGVSCHEQKGSLHVLLMSMWRHLLSRKREAKRMPVGFVKI